MNLINLSSTEQAAERELLVRFNEFWASQANQNIRTTYDRFIGGTPMVPGTRVAEVNDGTVRGWWVHPEAAAPLADKAILFVHGGAYVLGSAAAYRGFASQIAARTQTAVFVLEYPLAPEHPWPAAHHAGIAALQWMAGRGVKRLAVVGDSAGGGLSLSLIASSLQAAGVARVAAGVVFSPWTDLTLSGSTMNDPSVHDALIARDYLADSAAKYLGRTPANHPQASPLHGIPEGMPPLFIQVGSDEVLLDDSRRYAAAALAQGGQVRLDVWQGLHHVFQLNVEELASSRTALDQAATFLNEHLGA